MRGTETKEGNVAILGGSFAEVYERLLKDSKQISDTITLAF